MTFLRTDPITGKTRGTKEQAYKYVLSRGGKRLPEVQAYMNELWRVCDLAGFDAALLFGQACDETATFTSSLWQETLNPAGIGALETMENIGEIDYVGGEFTAATAAWAHVMHMVAYVYGDILSTHPLYPYRKYDPRFDAVIKAGYGGKAKTLSYLDTRWAANPNYSAQIVAHCINAFGAVAYQPRTPSVPTQPKEPVSMGMKAYRFVGLDKDVWLPDDIVVEIAIVPSTVRNVRSNVIFTGQTSYTQHETANFNYGANADMHKRWLHGGASGSYVGFNFVVDDKKIIQLTPLNEVTWAAGTTEGNMYSWHTELCVNSDINHTIARKNAAALAGGILAAKGWDTSKLYQHFVWYGKDCPFLLRREGRWAQFVAQVGSFLAAAKEGGNPVPTPPSASFRIGTGVKAVGGYNLRRGPSTSFASVTVLAANTPATIIGGPVTAGGYVWWNLKGTFGTGYMVQEGLIKVSDPAPPPPVFDGTRDVVINGITFHADKRTVRVNANTKVRQYAGTDSKELRVVPAWAYENVLGWVTGESVDGISKWWVTRDGRMWSGTTV